LTARSSAGNMVGMGSSRFFYRLTFLIGVAAATVAGAEPVEFARDIQPILQRHCTKCHGGVRREAGLSLLAPGGRGESGKPLIVAGKPADSELLRRVTASDPAERMPADLPPLATAEIATLRRWIEEGAAWPRHWSFVPIAAQQPPLVGADQWSRTAIDAFVLGKLKKSNVAPSAAADRFTLIRRLSLDLLGLPPTPVEADEFVADSAPDAAERLVDRLLASPHFGERWGRHWLDQARYADSDGYEVDKPRPDAYRWRDWVVAAINCDLPLDQFTVEQFAGDLLPDATHEQRLATAYHRQTLTNNEGGVDQEEYRFKAVLDRAANTAAVWLGLTLSCATCHDHPYDPFTQREFYSLAAIFNGADEAEIELPDEEQSRGRPKKFRVLSQRETPHTTRLLKRGDWLTPGDEVPSALLTRLHSQQHLSAAAPNRLDLARWLVDPANPLAARVATNQIWLKLFGQGLVRAPEDFGSRGQMPTHPELLDWLATDLRTGGWSRKALIRRIVTSSTYRQASHRRRELDLADPQSRLLARQNRVRVEAEIVRDLQLAAGGLLDRRIGGASVFPPLSAEFIKITFRSQLPWKTSPGGDRYRRGMYTFFKRSVPYPDLMLFDCPDASTAAVQRTASNTPLQALMTLNSETALEAARGLASELRCQSAGSTQELVQAAFRRCLTRPPTAAELSRLTALHEQHQAWYADHTADATALAGSQPPEAAALVATANVILNLDEFLVRE
jgi:uncharacterized protein DUF1553/uncharacterized protein DUF1549/cytochrome c